MSARNLLLLPGRCRACGMNMTPSTSVVDAGWCANIRCADRHHIQPWRKVDPALGRDVRERAERVGLV